MMKHYTACLTNVGAARIISVKANNRAEAYLEIRKELNTPSRQFVLSQWEGNGAWIIETTKMVP